MPPSMLPFDQIEEFPLVDVVYPPSSILVPQERYIDGKLLAKRLRLERLGAIRLRMRQ